MVAAKVKMNANGAHTFLEARNPLCAVADHSYEVELQIAKARFGTSVHMLFTFYGFLCILVVCGSLLRTYAVLPGTYFLLIFVISSWGRCNCERTHRDERYRGLFPTPDRYRCLRDLWRASRDIHVRLGTYGYSLHCHISIHGTRIVRSQLTIILKVCVLIDACTVERRRKQEALALCTTCSRRLALILL